jgi:hypothetical protein
VTCAGGGGVDPVGDFADLGRQVEVGPQVVLLEARQMHPLVVLRQFVEGGEAPASPTRPRSSAPCSSSRISKSPASQMIYMPDAAHYQPEQPHRPSRQGPRPAEIKMAQAQGA